MSSREILARSAALDERRMEQINRQKESIDRLLDRHTRALQTLRSTELAPAQAIAEAINILEGK